MDAARCYTETVRIARKPHICCECDRTISPGEQYHIARGNWEGEWLEFKWCRYCDEVKHEVLAHYRGITEKIYPFGELLEWAENMR